MSDLTDPAYYRESIRRARNERTSQIIRQYANEVLKPYDVGALNFWVGEVNIKVLCSLFIDDVFVMPRDHIAMSGSLDEDYLASWLGHRVGLYFQSLMNEPVPDNIILGEY